MDKKQLTTPQINDHMILLEFFVERVTFNEKIDPNLQTGRTTIDFQFLDNDPITVESAGGILEDTDICSQKSFNMGKTCLFSLTPEQAEEASRLFDLYIRVYQTNKCGVQSNNLVGIALIPLTNIFKEILRKAGDKSSESTPGASKFIRNSMPLTDLENYPTVVGHLCASVRLTCFGKYIQTDFQMNMDHKSIDYKANQAAYRLKYHKKLEACPEQCGPTTPIPCASPKTCGLNAPHIDPTPSPPDPNSESASPKGKKGKNKNNKGKGKGKGKKGKGKGNGAKGKGKKKNVTPGSCKSDTSCPDTCPSVYSAMQEIKMKDAQLKENIKTEPASCPPSCYAKELNTHIKWNDCSPSCPSAPDQRNGDCSSCCPVSKAFEPQACPPPDFQPTGPQICPPTGPCGSKTEQPCCAYLSTQPGQTLPKQVTCPRPACATPLPSGTAAVPVQSDGTAPCASAAGQSPQYAPAFYIGKANPTQPQNRGEASNQQSNIPCICGQKPVTMMHASEPNFSPNPPSDLFHVNMGLGGSLNARVHAETIPNKMPCPVNYMPPPTLNDLSGGHIVRPKQTLQGNRLSGNSGPPCQLSRQPQIIEMRPGLDEETPFRFAVGDGAIDQNQLCVSPPTYVANDGTKYTEISDPKKQVFVMRIGKKYEGTLGGRNNIDLHLTTPPPPPPEAEVTCTYQQYNITDTPPGAEYRLGPVSNKDADNTNKKSKKTAKKGGKKGGKKGKKK